jgi:hypothetical protein
LFFRALQRLAIIVSMESVKSADRGVAIRGECVDFATVEAVMWATIPTELSGGQGVTNGQVLVSTHVRITQR